MSRPNTYVIEVLRTTVDHVTVIANSPEEAYQQVNGFDFALPPFGELVDYEFAVYATNEEGQITGDELLRQN